jgi:hypothetical protein
MDVGDRGMTGGRGLDANYGKHAEEDGNEKERDGVMQHARHQDLRGYRKWRLNYQTTAPSCIMELKMDLALNP